MRHAAPRRCTGGGAAQHSTRCKTNVSTQSTHSNTICAPYCNVERVCRSVAECSVRLQRSSAIDKADTRSMERRRATWEARRQRAEHTWVMHWEAAEGERSVRRQADLFEIPCRVFSRVRERRRSRRPATHATLRPVRTEVGRNTNARQPLDAQAQSCGVTEAGQLEGPYYVRSMPLRTVMSDVA